MKLLVLIYILCSCFYSYGESIGSKGQSCQSDDLMASFSSQVFAGPIGGGKKKSPFCSACLNDPVGHCVDASCEKLRSWDCSEKKSLLAITNSCFKNFGGGCLKAVCSHLPHSVCSDKNNLIQINKACAGNVGGSCVNKVCGRLKNGDCNELTELLEVARSCNTGL